jgi:hypothetical protein
LTFQAADQLILAFDLFDHFHPAVPKSLFLRFLRSDACIEEEAKEDGFISFQDEEIDIAYLKG